MQITLLSATLTFSTFFFRALFKEKITFLLGTYAKSLDPDDFPIYAVLLRWALYCCETNEFKCFRILLRMRLDVAICILLVETKKI